MMPDKIKNDDWECMLTNPIRVISMDNHPEVVAYCSAKMPQHWFYAMRLKWANDWSVANKLEHKLWLVAVNMCNRQGWKVPTGREYLRRMAGLAIAEVANPARYHCPEAWRLKVEWMGCDQRNWYRTWLARYDLIYREFEEWTNRAYRWIKLHPEHIRRHAERRKARAKKYLHPLDAKRQPSGSQMVQLELPPSEPMVINWAALNRPVLEVKT